MNCIKARRRLDMYMDNELLLPENMEILEHLNLCRTCKDVFEAEEKLRSILKGELSEPQPPPGLSARIKGALREAPAKPNFNLPWRGWKIAIAAVFFVTVSALVLLNPTREAPQALAAEIVTRHDSVRPDFYSIPPADAIQLSPDSPTSAQEFFKRHVSHEICLHDFRPLGYQPVGASMWSHRGKPVCWTTDKDARGHVLSHSLVPTPIAMGKEPVLLQERGRAVLLVPQAKLGMTCVFVFDDVGDAEPFMLMMKSGR